MVRNTASKSWWGNTKNGHVGREILLNTATKKYSLFQLEDKLNFNVIDASTDEREKVNEEGREKGKRSQREQELRLDALTKDLSSQLQQLERDLEDNRRNHETCDPARQTVVLERTLTSVNGHLRPRLFFLNLTVHDLLAETEDRPQRDGRREQAESLREEVIRLYLLLDMFRAELEEETGKSGTGILAIPGTVISSYEEHVRRLEQFQTQPPALWCAGKVVTPGRRIWRVSLAIASVLGLVMILAFLLARPHCCDTGPFTLPYRIYPVIYGYGPKPF